MAEEEVDEEQPWVPSTEDVQNALSGLAKCVTDEGASVVFTKLSLPGSEGRRIKDLNFSIALLEHVRHLDISNNKYITDINEQVTQMDKLLSLQASGNSLMSFEPTIQLKFLQTIDLSNNKLTSWPALESPHLRYLNLSSNELSSISGLDKNTELQTLLLANNKPLTLCEGLGLPSLRELTLSNCGLESLEGLSTLMLPTLDLTDNALKNLKGLATSGVLKKLILDGNPLESLDAVDALVDVGLTDIKLPEIPEAPADLRIQVILKLSTKKDAAGKPIITLSAINGAAVTAEEIEQAFPAPAEEAPAE